MQQASFGSSSKSDSVEVDRAEEVGRKGASGDNSNAVKIGSNVGSGSSGEKTLSSKVERDGGTGVLRASSAPPPEIGAIDTSSATTSDHAKSGKRTDDVEKLPTGNKHSFQPLDGGTSNRSQKKRKAVSPTALATGAAAGSQ